QDEDEDSAGFHEDRSAPPAADREDHSGLAAPGHRVVQPERGKDEREEQDERTTVVMARAPAEHRYREPPGEEVARIEHVEALLLKESANRGGVIELVASVLE